MKPEDARKLADELAGRNIESVGMLSRNERDQIVSVIRTLADQLEGLTKALRSAQQTLIDIAGDADLAETEAFRALRQGGAQ